MNTEAREKILSKLSSLEDSLKMASNIFNESLFIIRSFIDGKMSEKDANDNLEKLSKRMIK
jgi:hypothetical protein